MPSDNITPHVVTTPPSPTRITTSENSREAHEGITTNPSPHAEGNSQSLQAEKPVSQPGAGSAEADPSSEPSTHTVLIKIRDLLSTLAPKAQPSAPVDPAPEASPPSLPKFGDLADYWTHFDAVAKEESDNMIKGMKDGLDNLLIFAALFSAVNAGFLAISLPTLSDDPLAETNTLLRLIVHGVDNSTLKPTDLTPPPFTPSQVNWVVNQLFTASLTLSLLAAFGALLAQQWIVQYTRPTAGAVDGGRWDRERKFEGAQRWKLPWVVEMLLPIILQAALFVFIIGFIIFLRDLGWPVAIPNLILTIVGVVAFIISTLVSAWDPFCPFHTPFSTITTIFIRHCVPIIQRIGRAWRSPATPDVLEDLRAYRERGRLRMSAGDWTNHHIPPKPFWVFEPSSLVFARLQRQEEAIEGLQERAARRFLETSGHNQLLVATAVNLPFPFNESEKSDNREYGDSRLRRLVSLYRLSRRRSNEREWGIYVAAIMHLILTQDGLDIRSIPYSILKDSMEDSIQAHFYTSEDYLPITIPSVATLALNILNTVYEEVHELRWACSPGGIVRRISFMGRISSETEDLCVQFRRYAVAQEQLPARTVCSIMGTVMAAAQWNGPQSEKGISKLRKKLQLGNLQLRSTRPSHRMAPEWMIANLGLLRDVLLMCRNASDRGPTIHEELLKEAFRKYDPKNTISHQLMMGIMELLMGGATVVKDLKDLLENLLVPPKALEEHESEAKINQHEVVMACIELVQRVWRTDLTYGYWEPYERRVVSPLQPLTLYLKGLRRQCDDYRSPLVFGEPFVRLLKVMRNKESRFRRRKEDIVKFRMAVALLPEDALQLPEELKEWVDEALKIEVEEERAPEGPQASTSADSSITDASPTTDE